MLLRADFICQVHDNPNMESWHRSMSSEYIPRLTANRPDTGRLYCLHLEYATNTRQSRCRKSWIVADGEKQVNGTPTEIASHR